jgi:hypothetical protein
MNNRNRHDVSIAINSSLYNATIVVNILRALKYLLKIQFMIAKVMNNKGRQ